MEYIETVRKLKKLIKKTESLCKIITIHTNENRKDSLSKLKSWLKLFLSNNKIQIILDFPRS